MLHAHLAFPGEDPGLGVGGGGGRAAGGGRRVGVRPRLPLPLQHGENRLLAVHPRGFFERVALGGRRRGRAC